MTIRYELDNGLTVLLAPSHAAPVVAMQAWVGVGSADETDAEAGLAHFHEHMLFKGTARRGVGQIAQEVEGVGGQINAWTSFEQTTYHLVVPSDAANKGLDILSDVIINSAFDPDEVAKEAEVILEEIKQGEDSPSQKLSQAMFSTAFSQHPYRRPIIGTRKSVRGFERKDILRFFRKWYVPNNIILVVAGDFDAAKLRRRIKRLFGDMTSKTIRRKRLKEPIQTQLRLKTMREDIQESYLQLGFHTPATLHDDIYALELLAVILGQGESSRLNQELERRRRCVNGVSAYLYSLQDMGLFLVGAALPPGAEQAALDGILAELQRIQEQPPSGDELEKARNAVESDAVYMRQSVQGVARALGYYQLIAGDYRFEETFYQGIARVQRADIQRVAAQYLTLERATICAMTPPTFGDEEPFRMARRSLEKLLPPVEAEPPGAPIIQSRAPAMVRLVLANGVRLVLKEVHNAPMASIRAAMLGGLRAESARNNGIGQMTSQLLCLGTPHRDAVDIAETTDRMAASLGGFSGRNSLGVQAEFLRRTFPEGLELFAECLLHPTFPEEEIERIRRLTLEEIRAQEDQPAAKAFQLFSQALWPKHPYGLPAMGTAETVFGLKRNQFVRYYNRLLNPDNLVISIVGDIDAEATARRLERLFGTLPETEFKAPKPKLDPAPKEIVETILHKDKMQAHIFLGFLGTTLYHQDHYAMQVLNAVLAGQGGRLFMELRDKMSLAYAVSSSSLELLDPGCFAVYIATSPNKVDTARAAILDQLARVRKKRIPQGELKRVKRYLSGSHAISLQYNGTQAMGYALNELYNLGYDYSDRYPQAIQAVTADEIQEAAQRYLDPERYVIAITQPAEA